MADPAAHDTTFRSALRWLLGIGFVLQGINHFVSAEMMLKMMPAWMPYPAELVSLSGVAEIGLGAAALFRRTRRLAGFGILALLVAVWPANWTMALHADAWPIPAWVLWARVPLQLVFAYWAYISCIAASRRD